MSDGECEWARCAAALVLHRLRDQLAEAQELQGAAGNPHDVAGHLAKLGRCLAVLESGNPGATFWCERDASWSISQICEAGLANALLAEPAIVALFTRELAHGAVPCLTIVVAHQAGKLYGDRADQVLALLAADGRAHNWAHVLQDHLLPPELQ